MLDTQKPRTPPVERDRSRLPTAKHALVLVLVSLLLGATAGTAFQLADLLKGILATEVVCLLAPLAIVLLSGRFSFAATLRLRWPGWRAMAWAIPLAPAASILAGELFWLQSLVVPVPDWYLSMMESLAAAGRGSSLWLGILALSVFPALAEEAVFRGFVLSGLGTRFGVWATVWLTALLFALIHVDPYRFLAVFLLGGILGFMVVSVESLYPALAVHALNNVFVLLPPEWARVAGMEWLDGNRNVPAAWLVGSVAVLFLACFFLKREGAFGKRRQVLPEMSTGPEDRVE